MVSLSLKKIRRFEKCDFKLRKCHHVTCHQKADKGNTVVILGKCSYISAIEEILNDNSKFSKLDIPVGKEINHIVNLEKRNYLSAEAIKRQGDY